MDDGRLGAPADVVAVEADVEVAERDVGVEQIVDESLDAGGEDRTAPVDAHDGEPLGGPTGCAGVCPCVALDDLMRDPHERAPDVVAVEDDLLGLVHTVLPGLAGPG